MTDKPYIELIQAEIDDALDERQRSELARHLLADPEARALREKFRRLRTALDAVEPVEPPEELRANILRALPAARRQPGRVRWSAPAAHWRYAALVVGVLGGAAIVFETVDGPGPGSAEVAGTIAAPGASVTLDTVRLDTGPVTGRVSLYRDPVGFGVAFELVASAPVDALITSGGGTVRVNGLGQEVGARGQRTAVALPGSGMTGAQAVDLTFLMSGREVGHATLKTPRDR